MRIVLLSFLFALNACSQIAGYSKAPTDSSVDKADFARDLSFDIAVDSQADHPSISDLPHIDEAAIDDSTNESMPLDDVTIDVVPDAYQFDPVSLDMIETKLQTTTVDCIDDDGQGVDSDHDSKTDQVYLYNDLETLALFSSLSGTIAIETTNWLGGSSYVVVLFNPNACGDENPFNATSNDLFSTGIMIRSATLVNGKLQLAPGTALADMNFINVEINGSFENEFLGANDSDLSSYPQLEPMVNGMKSLILDLASK